MPILSYVPEPRAGELEVILTEVDFDLAISYFSEARNQGQLDARAIKNLLGTAKDFYFGKSCEYMLVNH